MMASESERNAKLKREMDRALRQRKAQKASDEVTKSPNDEKFQNLHIYNALRNRRAKVLSLVCDNTSRHGGETLLLSTIYFAYVRGEPNLPRYRHVQNHVPLFGITNEDVYRGETVRRMNLNTLERLEAKGEVVANKPTIECVCLHQVRIAPEDFLQVLKIFIDEGLTEVSLSFLELAHERRKKGMTRP